MLVSIYLANEGKVRHPVKVDSVHDNDDYAFLPHPHTLNFRVVIQFLKLLHVLIVPHNNFVLGPLWILPTANERHYILFVQHLNYADTSKQVSLQLQSQRVTLVDSKAILRAYSYAGLILVESNE